MVIDLPWPPSALSPNARIHWAKRAPIAKAYRAACYATTMEAAKHLGPAWFNAKRGEAEASGELQIEVYFNPPDRRHRDWDNCVAAIKHGLDGVAEALDIDDRYFMPSFTFYRAVIPGGCVQVHV